MAIDGKKLVIGVDGGGTKTHGILWREDGELLSETFVGSSNPHSNPHEKVRAALHGLVDDLLKKADVKLAAVDGICMGMAGCDRPSDKSLLENIMREHVGADLKLLVVNDAVIAMVAVLGRMHGILGIGGTGSICYGYNERRDERRRCGGWGHLLGDEGSGYMIGLMALRAILQVYDERCAPTTLTDRILGDQKLRSPTELVQWTYLSHNGKPEIAALARFVHEEAVKGDATAVRILENQASELVELIRPVYTKLFDKDEQVPVGLWGGNLIHAEFYQNLFRKYLGESGMNLVPVVRDVAAVQGAATCMIQNL